MSTITVYTKPACVQCNAVFKMLDKEGISYEKIDLTVDNEARDYGLFAVEGVAVLGASLPG